MTNDGMMKGQGPLLRDFCAKLAKGSAGWHATAFDHDYGLDSDHFRRLRVAWRHDGVCESATARVDGAEFPADSVTNPGVRLGTGHCPHLGHWHSRWSELGADVVRGVKCDRN